MAVEAPYLRSSCLPPGRWGDEAAIQGTNHTRHAQLKQAHTMALAGLADYGSSSEDEEEQQKIEEAKLEVSKK